MRLPRSKFLRFAFVGTMGFAVDATVLYLALTSTSLGLYSGRAISYLSAATFTWTVNRVFTFRDAPPAHAGKQWIKFVSANTVGAMVNYGTYVALVSFIGLVADRPIIGVAVGSLLGLSFNFWVSRTWVFKVNP